MSPKRICILIAGGTVLHTPLGTLHGVQRKEDIPSWFSVMPEVHLLAKDPEILLLHGGSDADVAPALWQEAARFIYHNRHSYAGFVLLSGRDNSVYFGESLSLMLKHPSIPVVITGSQFPDYLMQNTASALDIAAESQDIGIRANLINAIHVVRSGIRGVFIMYGDRLMEGTGLELTREMRAIPFRYSRERLVGTIEFSVKLTPEYEKKVRAEGHGEMQLHDALETRILCSEIIPSFHTINLAEELQKYRGALFYLPSSVSYPAHLIEVARTMVPRIPVIFAGRSLILPHDFRAIAAGLEQEGVIFIGERNREAVLVRLMWALGKTSDIAEIKQILQR